MQALTKLILHFVLQCQHFSSKKWIGHDSELLFAVSDPRCCPSIRRVCGMHVLTLVLDLQGPATHRPQQYCRKNDLRPAAKGRTPADARRVAARGAQPHGPLNQAQPAEWGVDTQLRAPLRRRAADHRRRDGPGDAAALSQGQNIGGPSALAAAGYLSMQHLLQRLARPVNGAAEYL